MGPSGKEFGCVSFESVYDSCQLIGELLQGMTSAGGAAATLRALFACHAPGDFLSAATFAPN